MEKRARQVAPPRLILNSSPSRFGRVGEERTGVGHSGCERRVVILWSLSTAISQSTDAVP